LIGTLQNKQETGHKIPVKASLFLECFFEDHEGQKYGANNNQYQNMNERKDLKCVGVSFESRKKSAHQEPPQ
jgi:hypothetical protein